MNDHLFRSISFTMSINHSVVEAFDIIIIQWNGLYLGKKTETKFSLISYELSIDKQD